MNEATARNIRVQNRYDELMTIGKHGHYETMFQVVREETESLRQQLADITAERDMWSRAFQNGGTETMQKQLYDHIKREVMLREAMEAAWQDGYAFCGAEGLSDAQKNFRAAYAATTDLKDVILCHAEPIGYYRPTDSGFCAGYSSEKLNDKWEPTFRAWEPK